MASESAGRKVIIWPDADDPGAKYAAQVAEILAGHRCEVTVIDALALASLDPNGGDRAPVKGWDATDAIIDWPSPNELRTAAHGLAKAFKKGPEFVSWGDFTMGPKGLTTNQVKRRKGDDTPTGRESLWIIVAQ
jgi:putative DNA primase/helicase